MTQVQLKSFTDVEQTKVRTKANFPIFVPERLCLLIDWIFVVIVSPKSDYYIFYIFSDRVFRLRCVKSVRATKLFSF